VLLQALSDAPAVAMSRITSSVRAISIRMRPTPSLRSATGANIASLFRFRRPMGRHRRAQQASPPRDHRPHQLRDRDAHPLELAGIAEACLELAAEARSLLEVLQHHSRIAGGKPRQQATANFVHLRGIAATGARRSVDEHLLVSRAGVAEL